MYPKVRMIDDLRTGIQNQEERIIAKSNLHIRKQYPRSLNLFAKKSTLPPVKHMYLASPVHQELAKVPLLKHWSVRGIPNSRLALSPLIPPTK